MAAPGQSRSETPTDRHWEVRPWQAAFEGTKARAGQEERLILSGQHVLTQGGVAMAPRGVPSGVLSHDVWMLVFGVLVLWHDVLALVDDAR